MNGMWCRRELDNPRKVLNYIILRDLNERRDICFSVEDPCPTLYSFLMPVLFAGERKIVAELAM